jgi:hypothetical protein
LRLRLALVLRLRLALVLRLRLALVLRLRLALVLRLRLALALRLRPAFSLALGLARFRLYLVLRGSSRVSLLLPLPCTLLVHVSLQPAFFEECLMDKERLSYLD